MIWALIVAVWMTWPALAQQRAGCTVEVPESRAKQMSTIEKRRAIAFARKHGIRWCIVKGK